MFVQDFGAFFFFNLIFGTDFKPKLDNDSWMNFFFIKMVLKLNFVGITIRSALPV